MSKKHKKQKKNHFPHNSKSPKEILLRKVMSASPGSNFRIQERPPGTEKMSDVIIRFAAPLLGASFDDNSYKFGLEFAIVVWNISYLPPDELTEGIQKIITALGGEDADETRDMIDMLLERKAASFSQYRRIIAEYELSFTDSERHLSVASTEVSESMRQH